jgi:hypothetical protein
VEKTTQAPSTLNWYPATLYDPDIHLDIYASFGLSFGSDHAALSWTMTHGHVAEEPEEALSFVIDDERKGCGWRHS